MILSTRLLVKKLFDGFTVHGCGCAGIKDLVLSRFCQQLVEDEEMIVLFAGMSGNWLWMGLGGRQSSSTMSTEMIILQVFKVATPALISHAVPTFAAKHARFLVLGATL